MHRSAVLIGMACLLASRVPAHQPHDRVDALAVSPAFAADGTLFCTITHDNTLLLRSTDGGITWSPSQVGLPHAQIAGIAVSPAFASDRTVFAATRSGRVFRSVDGGGTWLPSSRGLPAAGIAALALSPRFETDGTVFVGTAAGVFKSTDRAAAWTASSLGLPDSRVLSLAVADDGTIFAATNGGLSRSVDEGRSWVALTPPSAIVSAVAVSPSYAVDQTLFCGVWGGGIFKSTNGGASWSEVNAGVSDLLITSLALSPAYAADATVAAAARGAVYESNDGGSSWSQVSDGLEPLSDQTSIHYAVLAFSPAYGGDGTLFLAAWEGLYESRSTPAKWRDLNVYSQDYVRGLGVSPDYAADGRVFAASYGGGLYRSDDGGGTWAAVDTHLSNLYPTDLAISPGYARDETVFVSHGGGISTSQQDGDWVGRAVDPSGPVYVRSLGVSPDFAIDRMLYAGTNYYTDATNNVYRTDDGGGTYAPLTAAIDATVWRLVVSASRGGERAVFAGTEKGAWRSRDGGLTWERLGVLRPAVFALAMSPAFDVDRTVFVGAANAGVFRSTDGGTTWSRATAGIGDPVIEALGISPDFAVDRTVFAATKSGGVYRTTDGGETWQYAGLAGEFLRCIALSPGFAADRTVFAGGWNGVLRSTDGGASWREVLNVHRYDESSPYVTREGGWSFFTSGRASGPGIVVASASQARVRFEFEGRSVRWIGERTPTGGIAEVLIDGVPRGRIDLFSPQQEWQAVLFSAPGMVAGRHSIEIVVTGAKHPLSSGANVFVDAFDVEDQN